jgi:ABC-type uncharacterized transport system ATPase subunit
MISSLPMIKKVTREGSIYRIKAENGEEAALTAIEAVKSKGFYVNKILVNKPSLNEVYLELTGRAFREDEPGKETKHFFGKNLAL